MKILIVAAGPVACGKSWALARLAMAMPGALLIEQHPRYQVEAGGLYYPEQHLTDPFIRAGGKLVPSKELVERVRGRQIVLLAADIQSVDARIAILQELGPFDVIQLSLKMDFQTRKDAREFLAGP